MAEAAIRTVTSSSCPVLSAVCHLSGFRGQSFGEASQVAVPGCAVIDSEHFRTHLPGSSSGLKYSPPPPAFGKEQERPCQQALLVRAELGSQSPETEGAVVNRSPPIL